jgi:hypothetical protein
VTAGMVVHMTNLTSPGASDNPAVCDGFAPRHEHRRRRARVDADRGRVRLANYRLRAHRRLTHIVALPGVRGEYLKLLGSGTVPSM